MLFLHLSGNANSAEDPEFYECVVARVELLLLTLISLSTWPARLCYRVTDEDEQVVQTKRTEGRLRRCASKNEEPHAVSQGGSTIPMH